MAKTIIQHGRPPKEKDEGRIGGGTAVGKCWAKCPKCGCVWETDQYGHYARGILGDRCPECGTMCDGVCHNSMHANVIPI